MDHEQASEMPELNFEKINSTLGDGEDLRLIENPNITKRKLVNKNFLIHGLDYSFGSAEYQKY